MINIIKTALFWVLLMIDGMIYTLINWTYQIILNIADTNLLTNRDIVDNLVGRIYTIIGVVMLFLLAYSLLKNMTNPDEALKGKKSPIKLISNTIISVVLIALIPTIFTFALDFQSALLKNNTIGKLIIGNDGSQNSASTIDDGGFYMSIGVFQAFFHPSSKYCQFSLAEASDSSGGNCEELSIEYNGETGTYSEFLSLVRSKKDFMMLADLTDYIISGDIQYWFIFSSIAGVFVLFVLLSYCLDIAVRTVKLAVYQLLAPIPILARMLPNEQSGKVFDNWLKATISTFLEVFVMLAILFFAVLIIQLVILNWTTIFTGAFKNGANAFIGFLSMCFIILGVIMFVKQAPALLKEITGLDGGKYGKAFMRGVGMMTSTLGGGATAAIRSVANDINDAKEKGENAKIGRTLRRAVGASIGANARGLYHGSKVEKFSDIPKSAGTAVSNTLSKRADKDAADGKNFAEKRLNYYKAKLSDKVTDLEQWAGGSFEAKQKELEEINAYLADAKAVKSTTEGFVRDKKYLFSATKAGETKTYQAADGQVINITNQTSLSEMEKIIQTLQSSGKVDDAKAAAQMDNDFNLRIKAIGKAIVGLSKNKINAQDFGDQFMEAGRQTAEAVNKELKVIQSTTASQYDIVEERFKKSSSLEAVQTITAQGGLKTDNVSDLADQLEISASKINQEIKLEQDRRKEKEKKK